MIRTLRHLRHLRVALCAMLTAALVAVMGIGALNAAEHAVSRDHEHSAFALLSEPDHAEHYAHADDADHADDHSPASIQTADVGDDVDLTKAHSGGGHHHHGDAPSGMIGRVSLTTASLASARINLTGGNERTPHGVEPAGLKRPPRPPEIAV